MDGARAMIRTLVDSGVTVCFSNPGTSEMHFVAALDHVPEMRAVLALFEGVATGAADGYARMADQPAATLLHLGPGLANGVANLHNARRAGTPVVNIVGDHATYHAPYDTPLNSDIDTVAANVSPWVRRPMTPAELGPATAEAVARSFGPPGQVATLILPADVSWSDGATPAPPADRASPARAEDALVEVVGAVLRTGEPTVLLLGGETLRRRPLAAAARLRAATGCRLMATTFVGRTERGAGIPETERLQYLGERVLEQLDGVRHLVLVGAPSPVAFFGYPGKPSELVPGGCRVHVLTTPSDDGTDALERLADATEGAGAPAGGRGDESGPPAVRADRPTGPLTSRAVADAVGAVMPEGAIVSDESTTASLWMAAATAGAPAHDWLQNTGGAIGQGLPAAIGAAIACPDRPVLSLQADGSAMYTIQALWTHAREQLDVTTLILNNRSYAILNMELQRTGAGEAGPRARDLLDLSRPDLDFVRLAQGMGVPAVAPADAEELTAALERAIAEPGPHLIDAVLTR